MQPSRRASVHSIDHFALYQDDLAEAQRFITAFGFDIEAAPGELKLRTAGRPHVWARVLGGQRKRLAYLSLGCAADDLDALRSQALAAGAKPAEPFANSDRQGFWLTDPDGNLLQVKAAASTQPKAKASLPDASVPGGARGVLGRADARTVCPTRLSHVLLFSPDVSGAVEFYRRGLGLNLSDRSADIIAFMHAPHGCDHHLVAFAKSHAKGFHHSSWDVPSYDEVGRGAMQMRRAGYTDHWGVGRHVLGSNFFDYVRGPESAWWEYSCHIDYVPAGTPWDAGDHPPEDSFYLWGADVPPDFVHNNEVP